MKFCWKTIFDHYELRNVNYFVIWYQKLVFDSTGFKPASLHTTCRGRCCLSPVESDQFIDVCGYKNVKLVLKEGELPFEGLF